VLSYSHEYVGGLLSDRKKRFFFSEETKLKFPQFFEENKRFGVRANIAEMKQYAQLVLFVLTCVGYNQRLLLFFRTRLQSFFSKPVAPKAKAPSVTPSGFWDAASWETDSDEDEEFETLELGENLRLTAEVEAAERLVAAGGRVDLLAMTRSHSHSKKWVLSVIGSCVACGFRPVVDAGQQWVYVEIEEASLANPRPANCIDFQVKIFLLHAHCAYCPPLAWFLSCF